MADRGSMRPCLSPQAMLAAAREDAARARREAMRLNAEAATRETQHAAALAAAEQDSP